MTTQILSLTHLKKLFKNVSKIKIEDNLIYFEGKDHLCWLYKYNIYIYHGDYYFVSLNDHPRLYANLKNILRKYENAKESVSIHKREIDAKIQYYEKMVWKKNGPKFQKEMRNLDISKYELWTRFGIQAFDLE